MSQPREASADPLPDFAADRDLTDRRLGDYHLLRPLGRGGMAEVYLADQQSLGRKVAFKVLLGSLAKNESYVKRFELRSTRRHRLSQTEFRAIGLLGQINVLARQGETDAAKKEAARTHRPLRTTAHQSPPIPGLRNRPRNASGSATIDQRNSPALGAGIGARFDRRRDSRGIRGSRAGRYPGLPAFCFAMLVEHDLHAARCGARIDAVPCR